MSISVQSPPAGTPATERTGLIPPFGGRLVDLLVPEAQRAQVAREASALPALRLSERSVCDLVLLATGALSPLDRFLGSDDYHRVLAEMRTSTAVLCPVPVTLPVEPGAGLGPGQQVALRDAGNDLLARMTVEEVFPWDLDDEAAAVLGTRDPHHPLVAEMHGWPRLYASGPLEVVALPRSWQFRGLQLTPAQTRSRLEALGRSSVVAFQTRNPLHRVHEEMTRRAAEAVGATLLLHPVVGPTRPGDVDQFARVRTYRAVAGHYPPGLALLCLLPLAMRLAGPREALWHALVRRNYGADHLIVGRDHASPGSDAAGRPYYGPYAAQELVQSHQEELGVRLVPFAEMVYLPEEQRYEEASRVAAGTVVRRVSGTEVREDYLHRGRALPEWMTRPEVAGVLAEVYPPRFRQGFCVWFTGLSGAGKSTVAQVLVALLQEHGRKITLLDGDVVRTHISRGLGFSREDRDANVRRIGWIAAEIARHGGAVVCAAISPYRGARDEVRAMVGSERFFEVHVATPLAECERRDPKGLYARARAGKIRGFTGIDDPYEPPVDAEIELDASTIPPEENARKILAAIAGRDFVRPVETAAAGTESPEPDAG